MPAHVDALGDAVAVAAMRRGDPVACVEMRAHAGRDGLLAGVEMQEAAIFPASTSSCSFSSKQRIIRILR